MAAICPAHGTRRSDYLRLTDHEQRGRPSTEIVVSKENHHDISAGGECGLEFFVTVSLLAFFQSITSDGVVSVCVCTSRIFGSACVAPSLVL